MKVRGTDLQVDCAGVQPSMPQASGEVIHQVEQAVAQHFAVADVLGESRLRADRLGLAVWHNLSVIVSVRELPDVPANLVALDTAPRIASRLLRG